VVGQLIPDGLLVTVPVPAPVRDTVNPKPGLKAAPTVADAAKVMLQAPVPEQLPLQPEKKWLLAGVAVKVTLVLLGKLAEHVAGQLIPTGVLVTVPVPAAGEVTVS